MTVNLPVAGKLRRQEWGIPLTQQCNDTAEGLAALRLRAYKTADQSVTSQTVLQAITGMSLAVEASSRYLFDYYLPYFSVAAADFKFGWTLPAGTTISFHWDYNDASTDARSFGYLNSIPSAGFTISGRGFDFATHFWGSFETSTTPGSFDPTFAQGTSNVNATFVRKGAYLKLEKIS